MHERLWLAFALLLIAPVACGENGREADTTFAGNGGFHAFGGTGSDAGVAGASGIEYTSGVGGGVFEDANGTGGVAIPSPKDTGINDANTVHDAADEAADAGVDASLQADAKADADEHPPYVEPTETIDRYALPADVPTVAIEISDEAFAQLDANPFTGEDVIGVFIDEDGTRYEDIDLNFRGAYALRTLIQSGTDRRNWKVKTSKEQTYRERREWNFNYEPHLRQKLAYDLMHFAGVKVPSARHVLLNVNGAPQGIYLEYEDPDSKGWLQDKLGDDSGDLYKAATDLPGYPRYFATTEYLGDDDTNYLQHYNKKTNHKTIPVDYESLRRFLLELNSLPDDQLPQWVEANFDWRKFVRYLVVANFISHWDGLPQRPKNFWLYQIPSANRWIYIPWDMDATFDVDTFGLNPMGTDASVLYQFDAYEPYAAEQGEGTERPLVRRLMAHGPFRETYLADYRDALDTYLDKQYLLDRVNALEALLDRAASTEDRTKVRRSSAEIRQFIEARHDHVSNQLDAL